MSVMVSLFDAHRTRTSEKYTAHPPEVLPMFVAEMDSMLAEPVRDALVAAVTNGDTGYVGHGRALPEAFADFAEARWSWRLDPDMVRTTTDVSVAAVETLRRVIEPGDQVVIMPPVYPPFWEYVAEAGGSVTEVPLLAPEGTADPFDTTAGWRMDLDGIRRAFADGARTVLLCNPHNPLGLVHTRTTWPPSPGSPPSGTRWSSPTRSTHRSCTRMRPSRRSSTRAPRPPTSASP